MKRQNIKINKFQKKQSISNYYRRKADKINQKGENKINVKKLKAILCVVLNIALVFQLGIGYIFAEGHEIELVDVEELQAQAAAECGPTTISISGTLSGIPSNWNVQVHGSNGEYIHIYDENGILRTRFDPPDSKTPFSHAHCYNTSGQSLDINGNVVSSNSPAAHIPTTP